MTKEELLHSPNFMKLGQAINHGSWQVAIMTVNKLQKDTREAQVTEFDRQLTMIKTCVMGHKKTEALNALAALVARRVSMLNQENE